MAALTLPGLPASIAWPLQMEAWSPAEPEGLEDEKLREAARDALRHWRERAEYLFVATDAADDYDSVPLQTAFTARVTYRHVGPLKPLPYPLDE